jgi:hypothetical protein
MAISFKPKAVAVPTATPAIRVRALIDLDSPGRLRVADMLALLRISRPTLYAGLNLQNKPGKVRRYPLPDGWDAKMPFWKTSTVKAFLNGG